MPVDSAVAAQVWGRYAYLRDNGHQKFVEKADTCEANFRGDQWSAEDAQILREQRRPALTINKILSTVSNVLGEQIHNRAEITFRPRNDADPETAIVLTKLYKQSSDSQQLDWKRSDMFADGWITSRGFLDMRMDYSTNIQGTITYTKLNPKNVLIDLDADDADPDTWSEVFTTKWVTIDDIEVMYGKADADILRSKQGESAFPYGWDSISYLRDRFGDEYNVNYGVQAEVEGVRRNVRLVERQHRKLHNQKFFVEPKTGEQRPVPPEWTAEHAAAVAQQFGLKVVKKLIRRIRWTTIADNVVLHDAWSPYKHFTVIPFFPYFRHGRTIGGVENLIGPQELLNKSASQELHIINGTANSGWKVQTGALVNMSPEELEAKGSQSGLVLELADINQAEKIQPNAVPAGMERLTIKAEEYIKSISGVTDTMQGQDREDVAAKAIQAKKASSSTALGKPMDSLIRTDFFIARMFIDLVQEFYTDERVVAVVSNEHSGAMEQMTINKVDPDTGYITQDLTLGEYDVVVGSVPVRETLEDSQFEQAVSMKEMGIQIPDAFIIGASRLLKKQDLVKQIEDASSSPEAQKQKQLQMSQLEAEVAKLQAEVESYKADAMLKQAKAGHQSELASKEAMTPVEVPQGQVNPAEQMALEREKAQHKAGLDEQAAGHKADLAERDMQLKQQSAAHDAQLKEQAQADKALSDRIAAAHKAKAARETKPTKGAPA